MIMNSFHHLWIQICIHLYEKYREIIYEICGTKVPVACCWQDSEIESEWPRRCHYRDRQWSDMTKTAYAHSYCCVLATRSKKCISVPFVWHQGWYIKFTVAPSQIGDQGWLRRRAALGGQGPRPASPPTVRRRLYRKVWIIMTMIGKSGSKIVLELNHPRCKAAGQQEELEIRIQSA